MVRILRRPGMWAGTGALAAALLLLASTGTCVASGAGNLVAPAKMAAAAPIDQGAGYGSQRAETRQVRTLQRALRRLGWKPGTVDGLFGPRTETALLRFQAAAGLAQDGVAGPRTWRALARSLGVRGLQLRLRRAGARPGPIDGLFGPRTKAAVTRLKRARRAQAQQADRQADRQARRADTAGRQRASSGAAALRTVEDLDTDDGVEPPLVLALAALTLLIGAAFGVLVGRRRRAARRSPASPVSQARRVSTVSPIKPPTLTAAAPPERGTVTTASPREPVRAIGYVSVPATDDRAALDEQASKIEELCRSRGWQLLHVVRDVENGHPKGLERPGLQYALDRLAAGHASCLVVSELERLSRSASDLGQVVEWVVGNDHRLVAIDMRLDTASTSGALTARTLMSVGQWESRRIGEQTSKGLAAARAARGKSGRPAVEDVPHLKERIAAMREQGMTLQAIADKLNEEGVPTLRGGSQWRPSSVQAAAGYRRPKKSKPAQRKAGTPGGKPLN